MRQAAGFLAIVSAAAAASAQIVPPALLNKVEPEYSPLLKSFVLDPFFTRELPPNDRAIKLYANYITKYLSTVGRDDIGVRGQVTGSGSPTGVEFIPVKLRIAGK